MAVRTRRRIVVVIARCRSLDADVRRSQSRDRNSRSQRTRSRGSQRIRILIRIAVRLRRIVRRPVIRRRPRRTRRAAWVHKRRRLRVNIREAEPRPGSLRRTGLRRGRTAAFGASAIERLTLTTFVRSTIDRPYVGRGFQVAVLGFVLHPQLDGLRPDVRPSVCRVEIAETKFAEGTVSRPYWVSILKVKDTAPFRTGSVRKQNLEALGAGLICRCRCASHGPQRKDEQR